MSPAAHKKLALLLERTRIELQKETVEFRELLNKVMLLERSLKSGEVSSELIESTLDTFPPTLTPARAGTPTDDGRKVTRRLWDELNHLVESRNKKKT